MWGAKGDVKEKYVALFENILWENKYTDKLSFSISIKLWKEVMEKAYLSEGGLIPGMQIEFTNPSLPRPLKLVVLDEEDFLFLKQMAENRGGETDETTIREED